jgi:hypothetical protein
MSDCEFDDLLGGLIDHINRATPSEIAAGGIISNLKDVTAPAQTSTGSNGMARNRPQ